MRRASLRMLCLAAVAIAPATARADGDEVTSFGLDVGGAGRFTAGADTGFDSEFVVGMYGFRFDRRHYRALGLELSYAGNDSLGFFGAMGRLELGLGAPRFNAPAAERMVHVWAPYLAVMAGYGSGTAWDTEYVELYGMDDQIEVDITGVPAYAAVGFRHIGAFQLRIELIAGGIVVTSQDADLPEGKVPPLIPSVGVRIAFGADSFLYKWFQR